MRQMGGGGEFCVALPAKPPEEEGAAGWWALIPKRAAGANSEETIQCRSKTLEYHVLQEFDTSEAVCFRRHLLLVKGHQNEKEEFPFSCFVSSVSCIDQA